MKLFWLYKSAQTRFLYQSLDSGAEVASEKLLPAEADAETTAVLETVDDYLEKIKRRAPLDQKEILKKLAYLLQQTDSCLRNDYPESTLFVDLSDRLEVIQSHIDLIARAQALSDKNPYLSELLERPNVTVSDIKKEIIFIENESTRKLFESTKIPASLAELGIDHAMLIQVCGDPVVALSILREWQMEAEQDKGEFTEEQKSMRKKVTGVGFIGGPFAAGMAWLVATFFSRRRNRKEAAKFLQEQGKPGEWLARKGNHGERIKSFGLPQIRIHAQEKKDEDGHRWYNIDNYMNNNFVRIEKRITYLKSLDTKWDALLPATISDKLNRVKDAYAAGQKNRSEKKDEQGNTFSVNEQAEECMKTLENMLDEHPVFSLVVMAVENEENKEKVDDRLERDFDIDIDNPENADFVSSCYAMAYHKTPQEMALGCMVMKGLSLAKLLGVFEADPELEAIYRDGVREKDMFQSVYENLLGWIKDNVMDGSIHPELRILLVNSGFDTFSFKDLQDEIAQNDNPLDPDNNYQHTNWYGYTGNKNAPFMRLMSVLKNYDVTSKASPALTHNEGKTVFHYAKNGLDEIKGKAEEAEPLATQYYRRQLEYKQSETNVFWHEKAEVAGGYQELFCQVVREKISTGAITNDLVELMKTSDLFKIFQRLGLSPDTYESFYEGVLPQIQKQYVYPLPAKYRDGNSEITNRALKEYLQDQIGVVAAAEGVSLWTETPYSEKRQAAFSTLNGWIPVENIKQLRTEMDVAKNSWYQGQNINCVAGIDRFIRSCGGLTPLETFGLRRDAWEASSAQSSENIWKSAKPKTSFKKIESTDKNYESFKKHSVVTPALDLEKPDKVLTIFERIKADGYLGEKITPIILENILRSGEYAIDINDGAGGLITLDAYTDQNEIDLALQIASPKYSIAIRLLDEPYRIAISSNEMDDVKTAYESIRTNKSALSSMNFIFAFQDSSHRGMRVGDPAYMYARQKKLGIPDNEISVEPATHMIVPWGFTGFTEVASGKDSLYSLVHAALSAREGCGHAKQSDLAMQKQILRDLDPKINGQPLARDLDPSTVIAEDAVITFNELLTVEAFGADYKISNLHSCMLGRKMSLVSVNKAAKNSVPTPTEIPIA